MQKYAQRRSSFEELKARGEQKLKDQGKTATQIARLLPTMKAFPDYNRDLFNKILDWQIF